MGEPTAATADLPSDDVLAGYHALRAGRGWCPLERDVIEVVGPDALSYLQGQLSQDLDPLGVGKATWSLLAEPTGKLGSWVRVTRLGSERFLLDVDAGHGGAALARLMRFRVRVRVEVAPSDAWSFAAMGRGGEVAAGDGLVPAPWPGAEGVDQLLRGEGGAGGDTPARQVGASAPVPAAALEIVRVEAGVPAHGREIVGGVIPAELGSWLVDASVSFTKGCYTGQELVARIDSRGGNVVRHLRGVVAAPDGATPVVGAEVVLADRPVGTLTSVAWSPTLCAPVALAFVHRSVEPGALAELRWPDGQAVAEVRDLPLVGAARGASAELGDTSPGTG